MNDQQNDPLNPPVPPTPKPLIDTASGQTPLEEMHVLTPMPSESVSPTPSTDTLTPPQDNLSTQKSRRFPKFIFIFLLLLVLAGGSVGLVAAAAYGKLPISEAMQKKIQRIVFTLPFIPKPKEFILFASSEAHKDVASAYLDASVAFKFKGLSAESDNPSSMLFSSGILEDTFEIAISGPFDAKDPKNPKVEFNMNVANQLDMDLKSFDKELYFKINKVPVQISTFLSFAGGSADSITPFLDKWVFVDVAGLESNAKSVLEEHEGEPEATLFDKEMEKAVTTLLNDKVLPAIVLTNDSIDGEKMYKFHLEVTDEMIDSLAQEFEKAEENFKVLGYSTTKNYTLAEDKPSDYVEDMTINFWIDKKTYHVRKADAFARFKDKRLMNKDIVGGQSNEDQEVEMAFSMELSKIGESFEVTAPGSFVTIEEYAAQIGQFVQSLNQPSPAQPGITYPPQGY